MSDSIVPTVIWRHETAVWCQEMTDQNGIYRLSREYVQQPATQRSWDWGGTAGVGRPDGSLMTPSETDYPRTVTFDDTGPQTLIQMIQDLPRVRHAQREPLSWFLNEVMGDLGRAVAEFHDMQMDTAALAADAPTMGMSRLRYYLFGETSEAVERLLTVLGPGRVEDMRACVADAGWHGESRLLHGGLALASVVPLAPSGRILLAGPEMGRGVPELDLGWLAGELTELEIDAQGHGPTRDLVGTLWPAFKAAYTDAYSGATDGQRVAAARVLRVLLHYCDFVSTYPKLPIGEAQLSVLLWLIEDSVSK